MINTWEGVIGLEGKPTGDGRLIAPNGLTWDTLPVPLRWVKSDTGEHQNAVVVGQLQRVERWQDGTIYGYGTFDMDSPEGEEAHRQVSENLTPGVSMDLDDMVASIEEGADSKGRDAVTITEARIRALTIVAIPAFAEAKIALSTKSEEPTEFADEELEQLLASALSVDPSWFDDPKLAGPTGLTVTSDGRVYGHLALFDTCHIADPAGAGVCVSPPTSPSGYAYFHTGEILADNGQRIPVGHLTMDTVHAGPKMSASSTSSHYENTGAVAADVVAGEDRFGIWVAGRARPEADWERFRAAPLSGDWRRIGGNLELVAALSVNVPGFPVPRTKALVASGDVHSLVASGTLSERLDDYKKLSRDLKVERYRNLSAQL